MSPFNYENYGEEIPEMTSGDVEGALGNLVWPNLCQGQEMWDA